MNPEVPEVYFAPARAEEVWRMYVGDKIKVRELNSGTIQVAVGYGDWQDVHE